MVKPVILTVDDPQVLRAMERDLRRRSEREGCVSRTVASAAPTLAGGSCLGGVISSVNAGRVLVEPGETRFTVRLPINS